MIPKHDIHCLSCDSVMSKYDNLIQCRNCNYTNYISFKTIPEKYQFSIRYHNDANNKCNKCNKINCSHGFIVKSNGSKTIFLDGKIDIEINYIKLDLVNTENLKSKFVTIYEKIYKLKDFE